MATNISINIANNKMIKAIKIQSNAVIDISY